MNTTLRLRRLDEQVAGPYPLHQLGEAHRCASQMSVSSGQDIVMWKDGAKPGDAPIFIARYRMGGIVREQLKAKAAL